jgi:hypothetical protein
MVARPVDGTAGLGSILQQRGKRVLTKLGVRHRVHAVAFTYGAGVVAP